MRKTFAAAALLAVLAFAGGASARSFTIVPTGKTALPSAETPNGTFTFSWAKVRAQVSSRKRGFEPDRTAETLQISPTGAAGLEPATPGFGDRCSAN